MCFIFCIQGAFKGLRYAWCSVNMYMYMYNLIMLEQTTNCNLRTTKDYLYLSYELYLFKCKIIACYLYELS